MSEGAGVGPEVAVATQKPGIVDRFKGFVGLKPKPAPQTPAPTSMPQSQEALKQIVEGKDGVPTPRDFTGPGVTQDDRRLMGEARATSPGAEDQLAAQAKAAGLPTPERTGYNQPTYIAQGTELDNKPLTSSQVEPTAAVPEPPQIPVATPDNAMPKTTEEPAAA